MPQGSQLVGRVALPAENPSLCCQSQSFKLKRWGAGGLKVQKRKGGRPFWEGAKGVEGKGQRWARPQIQQTIGGWAKSASAPASFVLFIYFLNQSQGLSSGKAAHEEWMEGFLEEVNLEQWVTSTKALGSVEFRAEKWEEMAEQSLKED